MNRKGFTAIMDAVFFVILVSIAVTAIAHGTDNPQESPVDTESFDAVMATYVRLGDLSYPDGDRVMKITDLWALSMVAGDGKVTEFVGRCFDAMFPWEDGYGFTVTYLDMTQTYGKTDEGWSGSVHREYSAEFGGTLAVTLYSYL